jgi:hypothetical protein
MFAKRFSYQKKEFKIQTSFFYRLQTPTAAASKKTRHSPEQLCAQMTKMHVITTATVTCLEHPSPFAVSARSAQQDKKILCQKPK